MIPSHIAVIMDGNGRWAKKRDKPRTFGHQSALKATRGIVKHCVELGIESLTLYAFSSENWRRPQKEITVLMDLFLRALQNEIKPLHENGVRVRFIGDLHVFSDSLQQQICDSEQLTQTNDAMNLNIAINYGGRWDIVEATRRLAAQVKCGEIEVQDIDEFRFANHLSTRALPDPDLMIRTSGEQRLSNYLLWQLAYTEFYFTEVLWPDFDKAELQRAIAWFGRRQRRYGMTSGQLA